MEIGLNPTLGDNNIINSGRNAPLVLPEDLTYQSFPPISEDRFS
jgi:hypothetical protein